jgi:hypothetical protein
MGIHRAVSFALMSVLLAGVVATMGCGSAATDDAVGEDEALPNTSAARERWRFRGRIGTPVTNGGGDNAGGLDRVGPAMGCDICVKAQQCCHVATGGDPVCSFSAAACSAMDPVARDAYVDNCRVFIEAVIAAEVTPPLECR